MIVLDTSLVIEWLFGRANSPDNPHLEDVLLEVPIAVPGHWPLEIANFIRNGLRDGVLNVDNIHFMMARLDMLDIRIHPSAELDEIGPLAVFAADQDLTSYDAVYVQLASRLSAPLATHDTAMRRAAQRLNIPLLPA